MKEVIKKIESDFKIKIFQKEESPTMGNAYIEGIKGNVISLYLEELDLCNLDLILPFSKHLKVLSVPECNIYNLKGIDQFTELEELDLTYNPIPNLRGIEKLENIKVLRLAGVSSIKGVEKLKSLKELVIYGEIKFDDIQPIEQLKKLTLGDIKEINGLEKFPNLEDLDLCNNELTNIKSLENLLHLKKLTIYSNNFKEIQGLDNLINLEELNLSHNDFISEIKGLDMLSKLKILKIYDCKIEQIKGLENLINLQKLNLSNYLGESDSYITKIQGLEHLSNLEKLELIGHKITELKNLPTENLRSLDISWNKIESIDYDWLKSIKQPCEINLTGNPVEIIKEKVPKHVTIITKEGE